MSLEYRKFYSVIQCVYCEGQVLAWKKYKFLDAC